MSKDYHEQTDQFQMELSNLIDKYTSGDADSPDAKVLDSPLEPRLNFQTIAGCLLFEGMQLMMTNAVSFSLEDFLDEEGDIPEQP